MYQEEIADLTAEHLRTHIQAYLDILMARYGDAVQLEYPKAVETANLVGGVYNATQSAMPALAVDVIDKKAGVESESLWLYDYSGHIAGVIAASSEDSANKICKRYEQATEMFVKQHENFHQTLSRIPGNDFSIAGMGFLAAAFSGAEMVDETNGRQNWIAGFRIDLVWVISEDGPRNHA